MIRLVGGKQRGVGNTHMGEKGSRLDRPCGIRPGRILALSGRPVIVAAAIVTALLSVYAHGITVMPLSKLHERRIRTLAFDAPDRRDAVESLDRTGRMSGH